MGCDCGKPKCDGHCGVSPAVLQINNPSECVFFHRVEVPASMGDSKTNPPKSGAYKNVLLYYEADQTSWFYSSDGIPQKLVNGLTNYEDAINLPKINGVTLIGDKSSADIGIPDIDEVAIVFDTVADMKTATNLIAGGFAQTLGFHTLDDGGKAIYRIRPVTGTDTVDEARIIALSDDTLVAELVESHPLNVRQLGVSGDGVTDDTLAIQYAIDTTPRGTLYFPDGTYLISSHLETSADNDKSVCLELSDHAVIKASDSYVDPLPMICLGYKNYSSYYLYENFASFGIDGGYLDCNNVTGGIEIDHCVRPYVKNITIDNVKTNGLYLATGANNGSLDATVNDVVIICNNNTEAIGVKVTTSDSYFNNIRVFSGLYGMYFDYAGGNHVNEVHCLCLSRDYGTLTDAQNQVAFFFKSGGGNYNYLTRCYSDGYATGFYFDGQHNNFIRDAYIYYWNESDSNNHTAFRFTSTLTGRISNAHIRMPALGTNKGAIVSNRNNPKGWFKDITVHDMTRLTDGADDTIFDALFNIDTRNELAYKKSYVFVGDSYLEGYSPDGDTTSFGERVKTTLGLTNDNYKALYTGGYGFATSSSFADLVDNASYDSKVTDVIVLAGYNDRTKTFSEISTGVASFVTAVKSKYPYATIKVGFIGKSTAQSEQPYIQTGIGSYIRACGDNGVTYITNIENALYNLSSMMASDGYHPNNTGQEAIARALVNAIKFNSTDIDYPRTDITLTPSGNCTSVGSGVYQNAGRNNMVQINGARTIFTVPTASYNATGGTTMIELASTANCYITGTQNNNANMAMVGAIIKHRASSSDPWSFTPVNGYLCFRNGKVYFGMQHMFSDNTSTFANIAEIQVMSFSATFLKD